MFIRSRVGLIAALVVVVVGAVLICAVPFARRQAIGPANRATLELGEAMGGADATGFARALEPRPFEFPVDHGPHPEFRTEWWYVTGNLTTEGGRRFGVQFTLFRNALAPDTVGAPAAQSPWATRQVYMGHFALTDVQEEQFHVEERFSRSAVGLAGARNEPLRVWLDDWSLSQSDADSEFVFPLQMTARMEDGAAVDLSLIPDRPLVLQGDAGLSQKGPEPGNASFYYSFTRLRTRGHVVVDGDTLAVTGSSWLDREWSTSALSEGQVGWDWFALQLADGRDLMVYRLRNSDGGTDPRSEGVLVSADGVATHLGADMFVIEAQAQWASPIDGSLYPSRWRVTIPSQRIDLVVVPVLPDQELNVTVRYWEGAVDVLGSTGPAGEPVGVGYVELTGYAGADPRRRAPAP